MSDIFQEVDEEVRRDKAVEFWTKYQNYILAVAIVIVLATGGYRFWRYHEQQAAEAAGAQFQDALRLDAEGKPDEAQAALANLQKSAPPGYANLSRFVDAGLALKKDPKAGVAAYDALANDAKLDPLLRDTAKLRAALARLNDGQSDAAKAALEPLAAGGVYRDTARLALASIALAAKDYVTAGKRLEEVLSDAEAPQADRQTAQTLLGLVASQAPPQPPAKP
jgi:hypothetical protein